MARNAYLALVMVQVFYGLLPVAGKTVFVDLDALAMTAVRVCGGAALFVGYHRMRGGDWPQAGQWSPIAGLATLGILVNMGLFALGLQWTHPVNATLIITIIPVTTYLVAVLLGRETIGPRRLAGILLALLGAVWIIGLGGFESDRRRMIGDILVLINALSFSVFLVLSKPWAERHGVLRLNVWMFVVAGLVFLPIGLLVDAPAQVAAAAPPTLAWLAFIVLGPTVGAYILNATALRRVPSSTVAAFIYLQTPISALAAWLVLGSLPGWEIVPAAVLILAGVGIVARFRDRPGVPRPAPGP